MKNGISEKIVNEIFDEMTDFALCLLMNSDGRICSDCLSNGMAEILLSGAGEYMAALISSVMDKSSKMPLNIY